VALDPGTTGAPDVAFGVDRAGETLGPGDVDPDAPRRMVFMVEGPSKKWREQLRTASGGKPPAVLSLQLGFDEYWVRQKNLKGDKTIDLGSGRNMSLPWLTSLDDPVQVLQLTGALVLPDGKIARVGAEGLIARRTGMTASAFGAQEVLTEADLSALTDSSTEIPCGAPRSDRWSRGCSPHRNDAKAPPCAAPLAHTRGVSLAPGIGEAGTTSSRVRRPMT
jgi:hypothetical protein